MKVIAALTDFGLQDSYVAEMKGALLKLNPKFHWVDLTHNITPFQPEEGAFQLLRAYPHFPKGTIFLAVVDPGVGGKRKCIAVKTKNAVFVGPDNGILRWAVDACEGKPEYFEIARPKNASSTFHGRDIFIPFVGKCLRGFPRGLKPLKTLSGRPFPEAKKSGGGVEGEIISIDRFGNLVTSIAVDAVKRGEGELGERIERISIAPCYDDIPHDKAALVRGSHGFWEISCHRASAALFLKANLGEKLRILPNREI